jgi:hypothetical protein
MFYSDAAGGFCDPAFYPELPADAVQISHDDYVALMAAEGAGKKIVTGADGFPVLIDRVSAPLTVEQVEALRLAAYADPATGSDRFFAEVSRMQAMGEAGWEALRDQGAARYEEIKVEYPWPA